MKEPKGISGKKLLAALRNVEPQIGGALRRLQVQEEKEYYRACQRCREDENGDFACFFKHATDEQKRGVITFAAEEGWREQEKMVQGAKLFARDFTETIEDLAKDDAPTPENDSWRERFTDFYLKHLEPEAIRDRIEAYGEEEYARGRQEERTKLREVVEALHKQSDTLTDSGLTYQNGLSDVLTALSEGEGR